MERNRQKRKSFKWIYNNRKRKEHGFCGHLAEQDDGGSKAVIVIMGGEKSMLPGRMIAERFADYGFIGLAVSLFGADGLPDAPDRVPLELMENAVKYLKKVIFVYMAVSARQAGVDGFRNLLWTGYAEMFFVNLGDFFGLDWFFRGLAKDKGIMIPGTEHCEAWNLKKWMFTLAIPEHCILWPLTACPVAGLVCAGIGALI